MPDDKPVQSRYYEETKLIEEASGRIVWERKYFLIGSDIKNSDGDPVHVTFTSYPTIDIEYWAEALLPILKGRRAGQTAKMPVKLQAANRAEAFANYEKSLDDAEPELQRRLKAELDREDFQIASQPKIARASESALKQLRH